jgi:hypothetical protein
MIDLIYFTPEIRCYRDGRVERLNKGGNHCGKKGFWKFVDNIDNTNGYNRIRINGKMTLRHRIIGCCFLDLDIDNKEEQIDHEDRDKLNNAVDNLRIVTQQENCFNTRARGYSWHKSTCKWRAQIRINNKLKNLGYFDDEESAHKSYQDAKLIYHII